MASTDPDASTRLRLTGGCHCGALALTFESAARPEELALRACGCSFCRRHGMRSISDPHGRIAFVIHDPVALNRYRFGLGTAEFLVCRSCGVYVGALMSEDGAAFAIANVNALDAPEIFAQAALAVRYDGESEDARRARRRARWTPAEISLPAMENAR